jgi:hypothetical protein
MRLDGSAVGMLTVTVKTAFFFPIAFGTVCGGRGELQIVSGQTFPIGESSH